MQPPAGIGNISNISHNYVPKYIAIISGITGQDGSYLAEFLVQKGYIIYGLVRRSSITKLDRLTPDLLQYPFLFMRDIDMTDSVSIYNLLREIKETHAFQRIEIYNLAAQSHVKISFETPEYSTNVNAIGPLRILEAIRQNGLVRRTRFYQACTSELYGKVQETPQRETTPFYPRSPYGVSKLFSFWITKNYRESYDMFACNGILFNHESERRGDDFVTRKVTRGVARLLHNASEPPIELGNIDAKRDWGHAEDYVRGMWMMLQQDVPDDYVLATGETHSVREFVELAFERIGVTIIWSGKNENEVGCDIHTGRPLVKINPQYYRPAEVDMLIGDASKAAIFFGWRPSISFNALVNRMVDYDVIAHARNEQRIQIL